MKALNKRTKLYAAYGSNLSLTQMARRCPSARIVGAGTLPGWRLLFRGADACAVATVERDKDGSVPILLWEITPADENALDQYEGWPVLYRKENIHIEMNGKPVKAMIYIMNEGRSLGTPSCFYYNTIVDGYKTQNYDQNVLRQAVADSKSE
jgi:gamma-glutamylcyclotransferase (GGCT)/AIG2-like uncharacterized protein YtfP